LSGGANGESHCLIVPYKETGIPEGGKKELSLDKHINITLCPISFPDGKTTTFLPLLISYISDHMQNKI
jgi:hypothetical protein